MATKQIKATQAESAQEDQQADTGLLDKLRAASVSTLKAGEHGRHAAIENLLGAAYVFKQHASVAADLVGEDLADDVKAVTDLL